MIRRIWVLLLVATPLLAQLPARGDWKTDLSKRKIELSELSSGGPPKDGIPSIDEPRFIPAAEAKWLSPQEMVIAMVVGNEARAYPLRILMWHELVNDQIGDSPLLVSYCPLCNSAIVFDRRVDGQTVAFGVSGMLRNSDMVMYDRQTDSLWQQITGEGLVGANSGKALRMLPSQMITFDDFARTHAAGKVLSLETGFQREYGRNPYQGYEFGKGPIMPVRQTRQTRLRPMERLIVLRDRNGYRAYPMRMLAQQRVVEDKIDGQRLVIFHSAQGTSPVDHADPAKSRQVGSVGVFLAETGGRPMRFKATKSEIEDRETKSQWSVTGVAMQGPLKNEKLRPLAHGVYFAFAWLAFEPDTKIIGEPPSGDESGSPASRPPNELP